MNRRMRLGTRLLFLLLLSAMALGISGCFYNPKPIYPEDTGIKYDPLANEEPDITLSAEEREIGGLGVFITKKTMDEVLYEYKDGKNILTLRKKI